MGDHEAGRAMGAGAIAVLKVVDPRSLTREQALDILDDICGPWRGRDAEFEAAEDGARYCRYDDLEGPLGALVAAAFAPERDWVGELDAALARARSAAPGPDELAGVLRRMVEYVDRMDLAYEDALQVLKDVREAREVLARHDAPVEVDYCELRCIRDWKGGPLEDFRKRYGFW